MLYKITIAFDRDLPLINYSGKLVKTLVMVANPNLIKYFEDKTTPYPKPVHVSPLIEERGDKVKVIYPKTFKKGVEPEPVRLVRGREYHFYLGYRKELEPEMAEVIKSLITGVAFSFGEFKVTVKMRGVEAVNVDVPSDFNSVLVKFVGPALFRDPYAMIGGLEKDRVRLFCPVPPVVFSVNVYELFREKYRSSVMRLGYSLYETHNNLETVRRVFYVYDGKLLPGVTGYAKFFLRKGLKERTRELVREVLRDAMEMGVGTGRASGFGHVVMTFK